MRKKIPAYMTVEASMIVPFVYVMILISIILAFFLYNHCIVNQSCYIAMLRAQQVKEASNSAIESYANNELSMLLDEQIYSYNKNAKVTVGISYITVKSSVYMENIYFPLRVYEGASFTSEKTAHVMRYNPAEFIRKSNKTKGKKK